MGRNSVRRLWMQRLAMPHQTRTKERASYVQEGAPVFSVLGSAMVLCCLVVCIKSYWTSSTNWSFLRVTLPKKLPARSNEALLPALPPRSAAAAERHPDSTTSSSGTFISVILPNVVAIPHHKPSSRPKPQNAQIEPLYTAGQFLSG
jgi:hypothetical protein